LITVHHIASDAWSIGVLTREVAALYRAFAGGLPPALPELKIQYADFAMWQRDWLQGPVLDRQLAYWREQLADSAATLDLPLDRPRPLIQTYRGALQPLVIPQQVATGLRGLGRSNGATMFMTLIAAFRTFLFRYSGQQDISIGTAIANRDKAETEGLIGLFINTLVLRASVSGDEGFLNALGRERKTALDAYRHRDMPFEKLVEELVPGRDLSHSPLFQVMFTLQNVPRQTVELPGVKPSGLGGETRTAKFDLNLVLQESEEELKGYLEYNTDLFEPSTIARMVSHFGRLLDEIVASPHRSISSIPLLSESEYNQLCFEWNETTADYPCDRGIHRLFEAQVERAPDAIAVACADGRLTYRELNSRSNRLARYLRRAGLRPEEPVGILIERDIVTIVSILAVLKAGGAYVPLDPDYPAPRLSVLVNDTGLRTILYHGRSTDPLPPFAGRVVCLGSQWEEIERESCENLTIDVSPDQLAYVIFTSGSTGRPKGVEISHRNISRLLFSIDYVDLGPTRSILQLAPISFDASTFELWGALLHGGKCVLYPERVPRFEEIKKTIRAHGIDTMWLTASLFNALIDEAADTLAGVEQLIIGGEALSVTHVARAYRALPSVKIINGYGPTESTTFTCCHPIDRAVREDEPSISIGRPISNTQVYVLDREQQVVPVGVAGELYIGGDGLARGYLRNGAETAEKFLPDPYGDRAGERLYRTGDLVRWKEDATLEYIGRADHQLKVRGFRIEPGEVESALNQHPLVQSSLVMAREDVPGDRRLAAYIVAEDADAVDSSGVRAFLSERLPDYMIPSAFVFLDSFPLTPNGKVDRRALPAPAHNRKESMAIAPRTPTEEALARIWLDVLKLDQVGISDDFFELGGHSLLATQVISRVWTILQVELPLRAVFQFPTIEGMARSIEEIGPAVNSGLDEMAGALDRLDRMSEEEVRELIEKMKALKEGEAR
jgi:amino acid adenylation domain-containing protein